MENKKAGRPGRTELIKRFWLIAGLVFLAGAVPTIGLAQWQEPVRGPGDNGTSATGYNGASEITSLLNAANAAQQKKGSLLVGGNGAVAALCLNASTSTGATDATNCITSWSQALAPGGGSFLRLSQIGASGSNYPADYPVLDLGYIYLRGSATQAYSVVGDADVAATGASGIFGYVDPALPQSTVYAGYFQGKVISTNGAQNSQVCLNGTAPWNSGTQTGNCISNWASILGGSSGTPVNLLAGPTFTPAQTGQSAIQGDGVPGSRLLGSGLMGSLVLGSVAGQSLANACGDGICSATTSPAETSANCPADCLLDPGQAIFTASPKDSSVDLTLQTNNLNITKTHLVVVRRAGGAPTFKPIQGATYATGQVIEDNYISYSSSKCNPFSGRCDAAFSITCNSNHDCGAFSWFWNAWTDFGLTNGTTYYYDVYKSNDYPVYTRFAQATVTPNPGFALNLTATNMQWCSGVGGSPAGFYCSGGSTSCSGTYTSGTVVTLTETPGSSQTFGSWGGNCSGTGNTCVLTMNAVKNVTATFNGNCDSTPPPSCPPNCGGGGGGGGGGG